MESPPVVGSSPANEMAVDDSAARSPATFKGQLDINRFLHAGVRRSPRLSSTASSDGAATHEDVDQASQPKASSSSSSPRRPKATTPSGGVAKRSAPALSRVSSTGKRVRTSSGYAPPSTYAHLSLLPDAVAENLLVFFIGLNPGVQTARSGHAYAHPSNLFWKLLYSSGVTPRLCRPEEDRQMPELYSLGLTNIVARPSRNGAELSKQEMDDGVAVLEEKARRWRPESMCVVGKSIWESIWRVRHGSPIGKKFKYGWQDDGENMGVIKGGDGQPAWAGARVFVATSTSGLAASLSPAEKQEVWEGLGSWVKKRRAEREQE